jgi:hypothetical protein
VKRNFAVVAVLLVLVSGGLGWFIGHQTTTTTTTSTAPTTSAPTTTTTPAQPQTAVWPLATSTLRFTAPAAAARSFAVAYMGFSAPVVGAFQQGDSRSGEVGIRSSATGPVTTVLVRQLDATNTWWVLGASTSALQLTSPAALEMVTSPLTLTGKSTAYEAVVNVELRVDGSLVPLVKTTMMGGSMGVMGPFSKIIDFTPPASSGGAVVLRTFSAKDGSVLEASVVRVAFAG